MRSRSSFWRPVIKASATTSAMTPTVTPSVEISEMTEMNACLRLASRYRSAMWSSKGTFISLSIAAGALLLFPHQRKQDHISDRRAVGQEHHEPIDPDPFPARWRQPVLEGPDVVLVHLVRLEVAARAILLLRVEAAALLGRIVQLAEGVHQ